jgi:uncharacterized RDD family membrane protein YckC
MEEQSIQPTHHARPEYANVFTRFGAIILDGLIMVPFYIPFFLVLPYDPYGYELSSGDIAIMIITIIAMLVFGIWNTIVRMGKTGQSLGRKFLNIAVLDNNLKPIGVGNAALREIIGRWISGLVCYIGYLNAFWDKDRQMWHDKMAKSYVFYVEDTFS